MVNLINKQEKFSAVMRGHHRENFFAGDWLNLSLSEGLRPKMADFIKKTLQVEPLSSALFWTVTNQFKVGR